MSPLLLTLLPIAVKYIIPLAEKLIGGKKSPDDTTTGKTKQDLAVGILQTISAVVGHSFTIDELKALIDNAVGTMKVTGALPSTPDTQPLTGHTFTLTGSFN